MSNSECIQDTVFSGVRLKAFLVEGPLPAETSVTEEYGNEHLELFVSGTSKDSEFGFDFWRIFFAVPLQWKRNPVPIQRKECIVYPIMRNTIIGNVAPAAGRIVKNNQKSVLMPILVFTLESEGSIPKYLFLGKNDDATEISFESIRTTIREE